MAWKGKSKREGNLLCFVSEIWGSNDIYVRCSAIFAKGAESELERKARLREGQNHLGAY